MVEKPYFVPQKLSLRERDEKGKDIKKKLFIWQLEMVKMVRFKMFKKWSRARFILHAIIPARYMFW